jgi:hypothetical protein
MTDTQTISPNFDKTVDLKDFSFRFRKDKLGNKRATVDLKLPIPSVEGIINILQAGGKGLELLQDAVYDTIRAQAAELVSENEAVTQGNFPTEKITWEFIANMPKEDRRSSAITPELWDGFTKDYIEVMPALTNKSVDAVTNATIVYNKKFVIIKSDKASLGKLKEQLAIYTETKNAEQFADILEMLVRRCDAYLASNDITALTSNL